MWEFNIAYHEYITAKREKRLVVLMALDNTNELYCNDASDAAALRQYLRRYTYVDYKTADWFNRLLYALPLRGMGPAEPADNEEYPNSENAADRATLLQSL